MFSNFSSFFLRFIDKDSLKIIQTKGNNISFERWYHKYLFSPEKRYKSSKNSLNTFFKNVLIRNFNSDKSIFRKGFFRIKLSKTLMYFNTLNHGILPIISMPEYMYIKNGMDKFQFQKKRSIFTDRINRNDILVKDIMEDRLKNPVTISSPAVLSLIKHYNITNPFEIKTTGPRGRLLKGDILAHVGAINKDFPLKLVKIIEEKEKLDLSNLKIKPKQPIENSFISIIIPVCLKSLLSMKESINEKLNIKIELSDLINKAIYKGSQKVPSIFLKKPSRQEILFSNVLEEIPKYYNCINVNINNEDFQIDYIKDKKTNVLWASPKIIRIENIIFPSSISLSLEEILEAPEQKLEESKEDLDIIDFLAGNLFDKSSMSTKKKCPYYTTFIRIKLDKSYTDIYVAKTFIKELKSCIETPETLLL